MDDFAEKSREIKENMRTGTELMSYILLQINSNSPMK
jgi:hypothetical protein